MTIYARDAQLYDAIYGGDDEQALGFVRWLLPFLDIDKSKKILDMGTGTGSIVIPLLEDGYQITGIEPFDPMLEYAKSKAELMGVQLDIQKGKFETLNAQEEYDLITAINGPLHYVDRFDLIDVFLRLERALKPGGYVVIDLINFSAIIKNYAYPEPLEFELYGETATAVIQHLIDLDEDKWYNRVIMYFKDQEYQRFEDIQEMSMFTMTSLDIAADQAGLEKAHFFAAYEDRPEERYYGGRLIMVYRKPMSQDA